MINNFFRKTFHTTRSAFNPGPSTKYQCHNVRLPETKYRHIQPSDSEIVTLRSRPGVTCVGRKVKKKNKKKKKERTKEQKQKTLNKNKKQCHLDMLVGRRGRCAKILPSQPAVVNVHSWWIFGYTVYDIKVTLILIFNLRHFNVTISFLNFWCIT